MIQQFPSIQIQNIDNRQLQNQLIQLANVDARSVNKQVIEAPMNTLSIATGTQSLENIRHALASSPPLPPPALPPNQPQPWPTPPPPPPARKALTAPDSPRLKERFPIKDQGRGSATETQSQAIQAARALDAAEQLARLRVQQDRWGGATGTGGSENGGFFFYSCYNGPLPGPKSHRIHGTP